MEKRSTQQKIIIILGPTSSGKSDIAIKLAKKFNGEIISADSRQIYRGMNVGTGKVLGSLVSKGKLSFLLSGGIPHHMIDIVSPRTDYNVAKFKKQSENIIENILKRKKLPIICGGTGFWIKAIVDDVSFPEVKPNWKLRKKLEKYSAEKLFAMLKKLDSSRAKTIDSKNKVRLIRAIEICRQIGKVPKKNTRYSILDTRYKFLQIGVRLPKEALHKNIEKRVRIRFKQGMIKEIEKLHKNGLSWKKIQSFGLAYYWIPLYLQRKLSKSLALRNDGSSAPVREKPSFGLKSFALEKNELIQKVIQAEKNYAKRQITWFKRDKKIKWLKNFREIEKAAKTFLK
jgi:tRNA dimethylallyltransferase